MSKLRIGEITPEMAQYWYRAVCDHHKESCHVMVTNPVCTDVFLGERSQEIQEWLARHYGCDLRLVHRDDQLDLLWDHFWFEDYAWDGRRQPSGQSEPLSKKR